MCDKFTLELHATASERELLLEVFKVISIHRAFTVQIPT